MTDDEREFKVLSAKLAKAERLRGYINEVRRACRDSKVLSPWTETANGLARIRADGWAVAIIYSRNGRIRSRIQSTVYTYKTMESALKWSERRLKSLRYRLINETS